MKKRLSSLLILCMSATLLPGCAILKPTPEKILSKTNNILAKTEDFTGEVEMNMDISTKVEETSISMKLNLEGDLEYSALNEIAYLDGVMDIDVLGMSQSIDFENYITPKANYTLMEDEWKKIEQKNNFDNFGLNVELLEDSLKLNENTIKENGKECFEFTGEVPFKDIMETIQTLNDFEDLLDEMDKDDEVEYQLLIDKKTYEPVKQTVAFEFEIEDVESELEYTLSFDEFNSSLDLKLPKKAKKAKVTNSNSFNSLLEGETKSDISTPLIPESSNIELETDKDEIGNTIENSSKNVTFKDFDNKNYAFLKVSDPYYLDDIQDWSCEVYVNNSEYSIAFVDGYDDSLTKSVEYRQEYINESNYNTLKNKEEKVASNGTKYILFTVTDTSGDLTYYAIIGNDSYSVEINISDYFVKEANLQIDKVIDDLISFIEM